MSIVDRAKGICLSPATEWTVIEKEDTPAGPLITGYVLPLAAIGAVAGLIGGSLIGYSLPFVGHYRVPIVTGLVSAVFGLVMAVVGVFLVSLIVNALAPTFGAQKNSAQALKVTVYSYTPAWIAGALQIIPMLGILGILAGLYGIYLLYLGLPKLMKCPEDKAVGYTVVTVICAIVLSLVLGAISAAVLGVGALGSTMLGSNSAPAAEFDPDSPLGRLQDLGEQLEGSAARMEDAQASGDPAAAAAAAMEGLGTLLGGGTRVEPMSVEELGSFVPDTFGGLPRIDRRIEQTGIATLRVSQARATFSDGAGREVFLEIVDSGGISGLVGLAGWMNVRGESEDASGSERTYQDGGRLIHERTSNVGGNNEFGVVIAERFMVSTRSQTFDLDALKAAVATLDLALLEAATGGN